MSPEGRQEVSDRCLAELRKYELWDYARLFYMFPDMRTEPDEIKLAVWIRSKASMPTREEVWDFVYGEPNRPPVVEFFIPYGFVPPPRWETIYKRRNK
jgi:hypothetical protein